MFYDWAFRVDLTTAMHMKAAAPCARCSVNRIRAARTRTLAISPARPKVASVRMVVLGSLLLGAFCFPTLAFAEVRMANGVNANRGDRGSSTRPVLDGLSARYDTAGDLTLTVSFFEPLGEPGALGGWEVGIYLADNVGTDRTPLCVPLLSRDNFLVTFSLGDDLPAQAIQYGGALYNIHKTVSPDRRSLRLRGADASLANLRRCFEIEGRGG